MSYTAFYCRVAAKEQAKTFEEQQKLLSDRLNEGKRIKTVICFNGGTSRELSDKAIRMIFNSFLRGNKYVMIEKPPKGHDFEGEFVRRVSNGAERNCRSLFDNDKI